MNHLLKLKEVRDTFEMIRKIIETYFDLVENFD